VKLPFKSSQPVNDTVLRVVAVLEAPLSERDAKFVDAYMGEANGDKVKAMHMIGYTKADAGKRASIILDKLHVKFAIAQRRRATTKAAIATIEEIHEYWTSVMRDKKEPTGLRLQAGHVLARSRGEMAPVRVDVHAKVDVQISQEEDEALREWMLVRSDPRVQLAVAEAIRERQGDA
jgi:hypothetical protein